MPGKKLAAILLMTTLAVLQTACVSQAVSSSKLAIPPIAGEAYLLGPGDKVRITLYGDADFSGEYRVSPDGMVSLPLIGDMSAHNQSVAQLRDAVSIQLIDGYYNDPRVSAEIVEFRPFYILGEVNQPGQYPFTNGLTLEKAVAIAGGYTYRANIKTVSLQRASSNFNQRVRVDQALPIAPGDTIKILERHF